MVSCLESFGPHSWASGKSHSLGPVPVKDAFSDLTVLAESLWPQLLGDAWSFLKKKKKAKTLPWCRVVRSTKGNEERVHVLLKKAFEK